MTVWEIPSLLAAAVLAGIKSTYGMEVWKGEESSVFLVWSKKKMYAISGICFLFYTAIWFCFDQSIPAVRITDLLFTYGILALTDGRRKTVPNGILVCFFSGQMLLGALYMVPEALFLVCFKGMVFAMLLFIFAWFLKGKMGWGDVKLLSVTAMTAGWAYTFQVLTAAFFLSFVYSIFLLGFKKKKMQTEFPFVPFLASGAVAWMVLSI